MNSKLFPILLAAIPLLFSCSTDSVWLSDLNYGFIANEYGPPEKDRSFDKNPLTIGGVKYEKGFGVIAPSSFSIDLDENGVKLFAVAGLDDESMAKNGGARFHILGDGERIYSTGWLSHSNPGERLEIDIRGIKRLTLEVERSPDGSDDDHADWADLRITLRKSKSDSLPVLYSTRPEILINHTGFMSASFKMFRTSEPSGDSFRVTDMSSGKIIYEGAVTEKDGDWGKVWTGDFSPVVSPGRYYISYGTRTSVPFTIDSLRYIDNIEKHMNWFLWQRCGDPQHGWERGQHRDDGVRLDNMKHQDVSGGWHDAADLRKWGMTLNGLWALSELCLTLSSENMQDFQGKQELIAKVRDEFAWGDKYYSAMQEPAGYLMEQVGGDVYKHGDNNRFTDNIPGTADDRWIVTTPNEPVFQYMFVIAQCNMAMTLPPEARSPYLSKALRCYRWAEANKIATDIHSLGASATAALKLFECTGEHGFLNSAQDQLGIITGRQDTVSSPVNGYIMAWKPGQQAGENNHFPEENLSYNLITPYFPVWSIVEGMRVIKEPVLNSKLKRAFTIYFNNYISYFDKISSYGNVPMALYRQDPGGGRKAGDYFYRWCYVNNKDDEWWNGINPLLGYAGAILVRGGMLTGNTDAIRKGQQQLDFIYGCNPFNSSTVTGLGYNQPDFFKTSEFVPHTPNTIGAAMAGIGSSPEDMPVLLPGWWQTTEYWMEAVTGTMMLLNELNRSQLERNFKSQNPINQN